jgi:hypothetical protein
MRILQLIVSGTLANAGRPERVTNKQTNIHFYSVHLPNDTLSITFENTVFLLIPKENATVSKGSVLQWRAR